MPFNYRKPGIYFYGKLFLISLVFLVLYACTPEKKLAKQFVYNTPKRYALVIPPDFIYKYNRNEWLLDSIDGNLTEEEKDSLLWEMSRLVKNIDDSIYLSNFRKGYEYKLAEYGFDIFTPAYTDIFMQKDSNAYIINIPQIELEETTYPYKDETIFNGYTYFHQHFLNALDVSTWFEINEVNDTSSNQPTVLYAGDILTDLLESNFEYDDKTDQLKYFYKIDTLEVKDVYNLAVTLGKRYAEYTYDYLMNSYILRNKEKGDTLSYYWHYDLDRNKFYPIWDDEEKLIPVEE